MATTIETANKDRLEKAFLALQAAEQLQEDRLKFGLDHVNLYVEDVESDWLETWGKYRDEILPNGVKLAEWFQERFEPSWQALEEIFCAEDNNLALVLRTAGVKRAKWIDLGCENSDRIVALIVTVKEESPGETGILVQVYPTGDRTDLPEGLQLALVSSNGEKLHEAIARSTDNAIQMELSGQPGERFSIHLALEEAIAIEEFVI